MNTAEAAMACGLFVSGTDTGVGKTLVGAALVYLMARQGIAVRVTKPFESGVSDPSLLGEDGKLLRWASGSRSPSSCISPYRLREPLAPAFAARREGIAVNWHDLLETIRGKEPSCDFHLTEGAGGLLVPLAGSRLVADLANDLGWPLLIVGRPGLGTINHTLLTLEAAAARGLQVAGWIISGLSPEANVAERNAAAEIARLTDIPCWGVLPQVEGTPEEKVAKLAEQMLDWPVMRELCSVLKANEKGIRDA